jgi:hypothetical protein
VLKSIAVTIVTAPKGDEAKAGIAARPNTRNDEAASPAASLKPVRAISCLLFNQTAGTTKPCTPTPNMRAQAGLMSEIFAVDLVVRRYGGRHASQPPPLDAVAC